jgi:hypothetical protein
MASTSNTDPAELDNDVYIVKLETGESQKITAKSVSSVFAWHY